MCAKNHLLIFSSFLDIWENVEWPRFFGPPCTCSNYSQACVLCIYNNWLTICVCLDSMHASMKQSINTSYFQLLYQSFLCRWYYNWFDSCLKLLKPSCAEMCRSCNFNCLSSVASNNKIADGQV